MTIQELLAQVRDNAQAKVAQRNKIADELGEIKNSGKVDQARVSQLRSRRDEIDEEIDEFRLSIKRFEDEIASNDAAQAFARGMDGTWGVGYTRSRDVYSAERAESGERSFFSDLFHRDGGDVQAAQRLAALGEERANSTGNFAGLVVPQYLVDQAALIARQTRPFANSLTHQEMPEQGMQFQIPKATTGSSAAVQATENSAVSTTDEVWSNVTLNVATIAGAAYPSRQSLERGMPGLDALIYADLMGAYGAQVETQVLTGSGASGQILGALNTAGISQATAFTAAATAATFYTKIAGQVSSIASARFMKPSHIAMHPRRWAWLLGQSDSSGRPLVVPSIQGPNNALAVGDAAGAIGDVGYDFMGLHVIVTAGLPTAVGTGPEDQVLVYRAADHLLYENGDGTPSQLRFEQTLGNQLTVTLVSYGYIAATFGRYPTAVGVIGGNAGSAGFGLVSPVF